MCASKYRKQYEEELARRAAKKTNYRVVLDKSRATSTRLKALQDRAGLRTEEALVDSLRIIRDQEEESALRAATLRAIGKEIGNRPEWIDMVLDVLGDKAEAREVRLAALQAMQLLGFTSPGFATRRPDYMATLRALVEDSDLRVREQAIQILALLKDEYVQRRLREGLEKPSKALVSPEKAIQLLGQDIHAELYPLLKKIVKRPPNPAAKEEAVRLLAGDPDSKELLIGLMTNKRQPVKIRALSAVALQSLAPTDFTEQAKQIVADDSEDYRLRLTSLNGLTHFADPVLLSRDPEFQERIQQVRDKSTSMQLRDAADRYLRYRK